ncbi:MAG TPA: hypothetical protein VFS08_03030 [Gemmatimonadaceae bacterium]|nr:hypothetical protein [Gemmatimonadaceae bacterium]
MGLWHDWRERRRLRGRAGAYARAAWAEPADADVRWLAEHATGGDEDHARWELRYCRRALALLVAERDALDDRSAAAVSHALMELFERDPGVAPERVRVAQRQFNTRLARYRDALRERGGGSHAERLAAALLAVASGRLLTAPPDARVVAVVEGYLDEAQGWLREGFGVAELPEHVRPSEALARPRQ